MDEAAGGAELDRMARNNRFEVLGKVAKGFRGASDAEARAGPVQFEKDVGGPMPGEDVFGIDEMIKEATAGQGGGKRYGVQDGEGRAAKRPRVEDEENLE